MGRSCWWITGVFSLLLVSSCQTPKPAAGTHGPSTTEMARPKNVIFMIGDGMGLPQITGAMYMNNNKSAFERFQNIGFHKSHSADNLVTDSAAGATAFASGVKTYNGALGVNVKKEPVPTILEMAENKGMATGILVTCSVVHATPAAFIAHVAGREDYEDIALSFLNTPIDIFIGGGEKYFNMRRDGRNLIQELRDKGYEIADSAQMTINDLNIHTKNNIGYFAATGEPDPMLLGRNYALPATEKVLDFLKDRSPEGFFLMIEGSQIDWGGHANDAKYVVSELHEFEQQINMVLDFAQRDKETLVVVTADHETGGFAIQPGS
ncbi:MAG TPA: alkaline phosphatase, partial [Saprospiraceae bacterium]|nr:alkaline phosphatase [Saprospiraceae bacterium]